MPVLEIKIEHEVGLHARPATDFVKCASSFPCEIKVKNATTGSDFVNAKSILGLLTLGVNHGHDIVVETKGEKAEEAVQALKALIENNFGE